MRPGRALGVGRVRVARAGPDVPPEEQPDVVDRGDRPVRPDPRAEEGPPRRVPDGAHPGLPVRRGVGPGVPLLRAPVRGPRLEEPPRQPRLVGSRHPERLRLVEEVVRVEVVVGRVRDDGVLDGPGEDAVVERVLVVEGDLAEEVERVVVPRPKPVPRVLRGEVVSLAAGAPEEAAGGVVPLVDLDVVPPADELVGGAEAGDAGPEDGNGHGVVGSGAIV